MTSNEDAFDARITRPRQKVTISTEYYTPRLTNRTSSGFEAPEFNPMKFGYADRAVPYERALNTGRVVI